MLHLASEVEILSEGLSRVNDGVQKSPVSPGAERDESRRAWEAAKHVVPQDESQQDWVSILALGEQGI